MTTADQPDAGAARAGTPGRKERAAAALAIRPSRGLASGLLLILLGIWTGFVHFVGPYFDYQASSAGAWEFTWDRLWFGIVPGVAAIVAGAMLAVARDRATGSLGAWIGLAAGAWLVLCLTLAGIWQSTGVSTPSMTIPEQLGIFYGLGVVITAIAAFAAGRMTVRSIAD